MRSIEAILKQQPDKIQNITLILEMARDQLDEGALVLIKHYKTKLRQYIELFLSLAPKAFYT